MQDRKLPAVIYDQILDKIVSLDFPPGYIFQERTLAEMLEVSRTPVREAIHRLAQEGWVEINARRNIIVRKVSMQDVEEIFQIRQMVERSALEYVLDNNLHRSVSRKLEMALDKMLLVRGNRFEFIRLDQEFHLQLVWAMDNGRLNRFWMTIQREIVRLGIMAMLDVQHRTEEVVGEHTRMIEAVRSNRKREARRAFGEHFRITKAYVLRHIVSLLEEED